MNKWYVTSCSFALLLAGCTTVSDPSDIVSQTFVHKYGFDVTKEEWEERSEEGQVVTHMSNGATLTETYQNGVLHGLTTYTYPDSSIVAKIQLYDQGTLLKETLQDENGVPARQEVYEFDARTLITKWDERGVPMSVEEYEGERLMEGKYYTPEHELEAKVESGFGERALRERDGNLVSRDKIEGGLITCTTQYHQNGNVQSVTHYSEGKFDGEQVKFAPSGKPLVRLSWKEGELDGLKVLYRNGSKIAEIPYTAGVKNGIEVHYDDLGNLTAEIEWKQDQKHGPTKFFAEEGNETEWYFNGTAVSEARFKLLKEREEIVADMMLKIQAEDASSE